MLVIAIMGDVNFKEPLGVYQKIYVCILFTTDTVATIL